MTHGEPLIDRIERMLFGATAQESVDMRLRLAERRLEERIIAALEADVTGDAAVACDSTKDAQGRDNDA